jgi:hypothetical protein
MGKFSIGRNAVDAAIGRSTLDREELQRVLAKLGENKGSVTLELDELPAALVRALLDDPKLKPNQRAVLALHVHGMGSDRGVGRDAVYDLRVSSPVEFGSTLTALGKGTPNAEMLLNGRWYPVRLLVIFHEDSEKLAKVIVLRAMLRFGLTTRDAYWAVPHGLFLDDDGQRQELTVLEVLRRLGFRPVQTAAGEYNLKLVRAERAAQERGQQVVVGNGVLNLNTSGWWDRGIQTRSLGTAQSPRRCVVDADLELPEDRQSYYYSGVQDPVENVSYMPFVRVFSLDLKAFIYADVEDVDAYEYDAGAVERLHLPPAMVGVLTRVFNTPQSELFGDVIRGKHGGVVILASGRPGVGKTLTAEVYAEMTGRTLYVLEFGELGATLAAVEENLRRVFDRVVRWNAVLQFDECEVFLEQRGNDLERSAIVGVFLRLLDYYDGLLFLTTNRPESLDHAIRSRVMLRLEYPDLDQAARAAI